MIARLFTVEVRRLLARRATRIVALAAIGIMLLTFGNQMRTSRKLDEGTRQRCAVVLEQGVQTEADIPLYQRCAKEFRYADELPGFSLGFGGMAMVFSFIVGATAGGAEWAAGTMQALLFWEPRRIRVIAAKVLALTAVVLVFAVAVQLLVYGLTAVVSAVGGTFDGVDGEFWRDEIGRSFRVSALPAFGALLAFGIAGFTRNTGAALGAAFGYFAILENVLRAGLPWTRKWLIGENIEAWVENGATIASGDFDENVMLDVFRNSGVRGGLVLAAYIAVVIGALTVSFTQRDVT